MKNVFLFTSLLLVLCLLFTQCSKTPDTPVTPKSPAKTLTSPTTEGVTGSSSIFDAGSSTYTITVPAGTDVTALKISFTLPAGASVKPALGSAQNFTSPVVYTVTAEDGTTQLYTVKVVVTAAPKSSEKQITALTFAALSPVVSATIDQATRKITATIPASADLTSLVPTLTLSAKSTVTPASGVAQNFTNPVNYTVTAEDGSKQSYEVKVEKTAVVTSNVACLCTRQEFTGSGGSYVLDFSHDQNGKISRVNFIDKRGTTYSSNFDVEYDSNGNVNRFYDSNGEFRFTYQNGQAIKMEVYNQTKFQTDLVKTGIIKFNANNEMVELNYPGFTDKFEYLNGNLIKGMRYDSTKRQASAYEYIYDTKNSSIFNSKPHGVFTYLFWSFGVLVSFTNNVTGAKVNGQASPDKINYTYNKNNFPVEGKNTDGTSVYKYTYANCQ